MNKDKVLNALAIDDDYLALDSIIMLRDSDDGLIVKLTDGSELTYADHTVDDVRTVLNES